MYDVVLKHECRGGPRVMYPPLLHGPEAAQRRLAGVWTQINLREEPRWHGNTQPPFGALRVPPPRDKIVPGRLPRPFVAPLDQAASLWVTLVKIALTEPRESIDRPDRAPGDYHRITTVDIFFLIRLSMGTGNCLQEGMPFVWTVVVGKNGYDW